MAMKNEFDFIIVGAGAAGCFLASNLSRAKAAPKVLLIEAGGKNEDIASRIDGERWLQRFNPTLNWQYKTTPQKHLGDRILDYDRGKGLGGSTAINFSVWAMGPRADFDELSRLVGDEEWSWERVQKRMERITTVHGLEEYAPDEYQKFFGPGKANPIGHGPVNIGYPRVWEKSVTNDVNAWLDSGAKLNTDFNSGNPLGVGIMTNSAYKGVRSSAHDALRDTPSNLTIRTDVQVARVVFDGIRATGIETLDGQRLFARNETILCCGALDTPRVLMHSGIGPKSQLEHFGLPVVIDNAHVGQHLKDHMCAIMTWERAEHTTTRHHHFRNKDARSAARAQWDKDHTGPLAELTCASGLGFLKSSSISTSPEFESLPTSSKSLINAPTVPHYEFVLNIPVISHFIDPDNAAPAASILVATMNPQSEGSTVLQSFNPHEPLLFDPNYFSNPFDRRVAIEATKEVLRVANEPAFAKDSGAMICGPQSDSDEDILKFWEAEGNTVWHMSGTARIAQDATEGVVDKDMRVFGVQGLRIADLSIFPILVNGHTQAAGYLAGVLAADKIIADYNLD